MLALFSRSISITRRLFPAGGIAVFVAVAVCAVGWPHPAWAQNTVGDLMCNVYFDMGPFAPLLSTIAWVFGGVLIGSGALMLKDHTDNASNNPVHRAIARIAGGAALMALPFAAETIVNTLLLTGGPGGNTGCQAPNGGGVAGTVGLDVLMENFVNNIEGPLIDLITISAYIMGILFIVRGLIKAAKYGTDPRANSVPHILTYLIIGGILIALADNLDQIFTTIFGGDFGGFQSVNNNAQNIVMNWAAVQDLGGNQAFGTAIAAALTFFQLIGLLAFLRGWYIVKNAVEGAGQATMAQGFTHIIGGVLAINIYNVLEIFDTTFGTGLL